jgi:hypothetical protein
MAVFCLNRGTLFRTRRTGGQAINSPPAGVLDTSIRYANAEKMGIAGLGQSCQILPALLARCRVSQSSLSLVDQEQVLPQRSSDKLHTAVYDIHDRIRVVKRLPRGGADMIVAKLALRQY